MATFGSGWRNRFGALKFAASAIRHVPPMCDGMYIKGTRQKMRDPAAPPTPRRRRRLFHKCGQRRVARGKIVAQPLGDPQKVAPRSTSTMKPLESLMLKRSSGAMKTPPKLIGSSTPGANEKSVDESALHCSLITGGVKQ